MLIRLIPPNPHPTILYALTFPDVLTLHDIVPGATIPAAWSSQLQILTSILQLEPPWNIHMLDRAVGLVARVHEVTMDVPQKEFMLRFVDERVVHFPMNSDCVRMLLAVVVDVKGCSEPESLRDSMESTVCHGSNAGSAEDIPSASTKSPKLGKHKRQRSILFSLISSFVPKSLSSSPPPPPSSAPPPAPLPPLPVSRPAASPIFPQQSTEHPDLLRRRARATLVDVWRRHILPAVALQHLPAAGYLEWVLISLASKVRAEIELEASNSHGSGLTSLRAGGTMHRRFQSESRNALDFGDRTDICDSEQWRCRSPSPFSSVLNEEDTDRVVYPCRDQVDEWGVRYVHPIDEVDVFAVEYNGHNDSLLGEHFTVGDDWDDTERLTLELMGRHGAPGFDGYLSTRDFILDCSDHDNARLADTAFDMSRCPLTPSDVNDDDQSDDSRLSLRTPEDGEDLSLASHIQLLHSLSRDANNSVPQSTSVSRVSSSRPRSRNLSAQFSSAPSTSVHASHHQTSGSSDAVRLHHRNTRVDELIAARLAYLNRICTALEIVRDRAREEGWRLVRATLIGAKNGWMDAETEKDFENKAKRRAWSSGIKISAPYSVPHFVPKVWDGRFLPRSPMRPPGLASSSGRVPRGHGRGPIVPTGLSLGIPVRSSPLAMYVWGADDEQSSTPSKYGILTSRHAIETMEGKKPLRVSFADNVSKLCSVCEEESEDLLEPFPANGVDFPHAVPVSVTADGRECNLTEGPPGQEDDPFYICPSRPRTRTQSMYMISPASSALSSPALPMFRSSTPPPSYQVAVGGDISVAGNSEEGRLDASALLLQPLSSLAISSSPQSSSQPPLPSNPPLLPRPRAVSMPTPRSHRGPNRNRCISYQKDEHCEDLSQAYASPPPEGPLVISATPAPHEQYPRYAHVHSPIPASKKSINATILGRTSKQVVFEQAGSEFTVGIEVALGRAEEGHVVW